MEDEIEEYNSRIDVYNVIPVGRHHDLTQFEVINSNVDGNTYGVGDEDEMQSSCYEYVEQLIDDIGYNGFSNGFARDYIDVDRVADYAEDVYDAQDIETKILPEILGKEKYDEIIGTIDSYLEQEYSE